MPEIADQAAVECRFPAALPPLIGQEARLGRMSSFNRHTRIFAVGPVNCCGAVHTSDSIRPDVLHFASSLCCGSEWSADVGTLHTKEWQTG